ncbi:MAG TPA: hypothetical protein VI112_14250 [Bacteroidia bacterium]
MKKIVVYVLGTLCLMPALLPGQTVVGTDSSGHKFHKNEAGINLLTPLVYSMGGSLPYAIYSCMYKRVMKNGRAWRAGFAFQPPGKSQAYHHSTADVPYASGIYYDDQDYDLLVQTDSMQVRRYQRTDHSAKLRFNFGIEWRKGKGRLSQFFGTDLVFGKYAESHKKVDLTFTRDSSYTSTTWNGYEWRLAPDPPPFVAYTSHVDYYFIGLSPFYGLSYALSGRFALNASTRVDLVFSSIQSESHDYSNGTNMKFWGSVYEMNIPSFLSDVSLVYRF